MTEQDSDVRECAHRRCEQSAEQRVRFPTDDEEHYCDEHVRALSMMQVRYRVVSVA